MFVEEWKGARKAFETATGKKKPCEKFLGVFNKSTGILNAVKELDDALKSRDTDRMIKAETAFFRVKGDYAPILMKAAKEDKAADYLKETQKLGAALDDIGELFGAARKDAAGLAASDLADTLVKNFVTVTKAASPVQKQAAKDKRQAVLDNGACSDALADIVMAGGQADAPAVQQAYAVIKEKVKAIGAAIATTTVALQKLQAAFGKASADFKKAKADLPKKQLDLVQGQSDAAETVVSQIETLIGLMNDELEDAKKVVVDAATSAKDSTKHADLLVKTTEQLAHRASGLSTPMVAARQDLDGKIDQQRDRIEADVENEADPMVSKKNAENIRMKLTHILIDARDRARESTESARELLKAAGRVPTSALANPKIKAALDRVNDSVESLEKSQAVFDKSIAKAEKALNRLPKP
jgi:hypothetical protein